MNEFSVFLIKLIRKDQIFKKIGRQDIIMNIACSTCLGSLTSRSDVSTIPCGHVFHTNCIEKWVQNGHSQCSQCRKDFRNGEIIKLYFSESQSENDLVNELEEAKLEANEKFLKFQKENLEYQKENLKL